MTPTTGRPSEGLNHWYTRDGQPAYEVPARNGELRPVTLRDARALNLVPSVTTILKCAAAPGLEKWKQDQVLLSALTLPRGAEESEACWLDRIHHDSREQARLAAERGTEIHAAIEAYYNGGKASVSAPAPYAVWKVEDALKARFGGDAEWEAECAFAHPLGFGGKADLLSHPTTLDVLLDFKTKDGWNPLRADKLAYDEHAIQLAAYRVGLGRPEALCCNVFVSRQEPWQVHIHEWTEDELQRGWRMFLALLDYHKAQTRYDASWTAEVAA